MSINKIEKLELSLPFSFSQSFPDRIFFIQQYKQKSSGALKKDSFIAWQECRSYKEGFANMTNNPCQLTRITSMLARDAAQMHFNGYDPLDLVISVKGDFYHVDALDSEHLSLIAQDQKLLKIDSKHDHDMPGL